MAQMILHLAVLVVANAGEDRLSVLAPYMCPETNKFCRDNRLGSRIAEKVFGQELAIAELVDAYEEWQRGDKRMHVNLRGGPGVGKTTMGRALAEYHGPAAFFLDSPEAAKRCKEHPISDSSWKTMGKALMDPLSSSRTVIVIDDVEGKELPSHPVAKSPFVVSIGNRVMGADVVINLASPAACFACTNELVHKMLVWLYCNDRPPRVNFVRYSANQLRQYLLDLHAGASAEPSPHELYKLIYENMWPAIRSVGKNSVILRFDDPGEFHFDKTVYRYQ